LQTNHLKLFKAATRNEQIFVFWSSGYDPNRSSEPNNGPSGSQGKADSRYSEPTDSTGHKQPSDL
jgi:hypothetical protein